MYKILVNHKVFSESPKAGEIWHSYGVTTTSTTTTKSSSTEFKEFETDDIEVLKAEVEKLHKLYGHDYIRIVHDITSSCIVSIDGSTDEGSDTDNGTSCNCDLDISVQDGNLIIDEGDNNG